MKKINILFLLALILSFPSLYSEENGSEYIIKKDIGEIARGLYEISPGIYEAAVSRTRQEHLEQRDIFMEEVLPTALGFRDAYLAGNMDEFLKYFSNEYYDFLIENYNVRLKEGELPIKSRKKAYEIYKRDILNCNEPSFVDKICDFWKGRKESIKNRVKIIVSTYGSINPKFSIGGMAVAFVELDNNNAKAPYSKEFSFIRENGKFKIIDTLFPDRPDVRLCVFCYYEDGEESVRWLFNAITKANE